MEIRSSSELSQFIMLRKRSRLPPGNRKVAFTAKRELPTTTKRPCTFSLSVRYVPATAREKGPVLSLLGSSLIWPEAKLLVAKLREVVWNNFSRKTLLFLESGSGSTLRERGNRHATFFMSWVIGWDS